MLGMPPFSTSTRPLKIAVLTSGGDAPGMNAAIRAVVRAGIASGCEVYGIHKGYSGLLEGQIDRMHLSSVANIIQRGGTLLKTDRCPAFHKKAVRKEAAHILIRKGLDALVVIGGDGSFTGAYLLERETGFRTIGIPGTIDNDIAGSEDTIGFDTAVNTAIEAIDRIRDTASSHERIFLVEVMGRSAGFIALEVGVGGGAELILVPEKKVPMKQVISSIERGRKRGKTSSILVIAEGNRTGSIQQITDALKRRGLSSRACILGHIQRGGIPTAHDRLLASAMGAAAVSYLRDGQSNSMVAVQNGKICLVPFVKMIGKKKTLQDSLIELGQILAT